MTSFSSALKANIKRYGFNGAMARTWKEVKQGNVAAPPKRRKTQRKTRRINHPRHNPTIVKFKNLKENDTFQFVGAIEAELAKGSYVKYDSRSYYRARRPKGAPLTLERVGSINVKVVKTGEIINPRHKSKRRKNPIMIYNPRNPKLIYGKAFIPEVKGTKTTGKEKGEHYSHKFDTEVSIFGLTDGSLLIKPKKGLRLWANESDVDKYDKT